MRLELTQIKAERLPQPLPLDQLDCSGSQQRPMQQDIPGTILFDGTQAQKGHPRNRMRFLFDNAENRAEFLSDEDAYCRKFGLGAKRRAAINSRNVLNMIEAGGNIHYLANAKEVERKAACKAA
jgi:protocatechuate 4,5-dioxygenase alpha subunit